MMVCKENHPQTDLISALGIVLAWLISMARWEALRCFAFVCKRSVNFSKNSDIGAFAEFDHNLNPQELRS